MDTITYRKKLKITWKDDLLLASHFLLLSGLVSALSLASAWPPPGGRRRQSYGSS